MIDTTKGHYLDLEEGLYRLRAHFGSCRGATDKEVLDWAKFFEAWSRGATQKCGPWSLDNLARAQAFTRELERSKNTATAYEALEKIMAAAQTGLQNEILEAFKGTYQKIPVH